ncbi:RNA polymerase sigma factor [uncultured Roseobacter sp.]|uniref:RNA polymerase sigma factor n=1 Tax=uncultured Roseobacter sp. TaxID=114847 RepID=UPI0026285103|nr:RNA polymerase sigma factor [uncultured Roseobacter sp.]
MARDADHSRSDDALLRLYAAGDPAAARALSGRLLPRVYAQALRLLSDPAEAEDVAQEAMMRLWRIAPKWRPGEAAVSTWLYRVTANLCVDRLRKRRTVGLGEVAEPVDPAPSAAARLQGAARQAALQDALDRLPVRQRQAVVLRHIEGLGTGEIAEIMQIGARAAESLTARGKRALTDLLAGRRAELGYDDDRSD